MRVLVTGGRSCNDYTLLSKALDALCGMLSPPPDAIGIWLPPPGTVLIHGGAPGADSLTDRWAVVNFVKVEVFEADWYRYGRRAGPLRNQRMIDEGKPDIVIAFPDGDGTADMVRRARKAGMEVREVRCKEPTLVKLTETSS